MFKKGMIPWNKGLQICTNTGRTHFKKGQATRKGQYPTEQSREKMRKSHLGQTAWNKGKKFPQYSGKNHPNWKGGIAYEEYGIEFNKYLKNKIRQRDRYECKMCKIKENGKNHIVHHIDYKKENNNENNLVLLCNSCHSKTNYTRENWTNYFKRKVGNYATSIYRKKSQEL